MPPPALDRAALAALIPHQGAMCLLESVSTWDADGIRCTALSHRDPANPLRVGGELPAVCGVEYAAQAMAVHGALLAGGGPRVGFLASVRELVLAVGRLDTLPAPLEISAERLAGDGRGLLYRFRLSAAGEAVLTGRAAVVLAGDLP